MYSLNNILCILIIKWNIFILTFILFITDVTQKVKQKIKQDIRIDLNYKYGYIIPLHKIPCNNKESIVNCNMNKMFENDVFFSYEEHDDNNVPNYDLFNKHDFDIFQQVETNEFAYSIVVSKWVTLDHQYSTIDEYLTLSKK